MQKQSIHFVNVLSSKLLIHSRGYQSIVPLFSQICSTERTNMSSVIVPDTTSKNLLLVAAANSSRHILHCLQ